MRNILRLISPIPPSVNNYLHPNPYLIWVNGKPIPKVTMYESTEAKVYKAQFKKYIERQVKEQGWDLEVNKTRHFYIDCVIYFDKTNRDANNYWKVLLDGITETQKIWIDDNVTLERVNRIYYDAKRPRFELTIYPVEYVGIFDDVEIMEDFEDICETCTRYKRNCSILRKAKEGRIQDEIVELECCKYKEIKK